MPRRWLGIALLLTAAPAAAQDPLRFKWQPGQILTYSARQTTRVLETTRDEGADRPVTAGTVTKLALTRRWEVKAVDAAGVATLELTVTALRQEIVRPGPADKDGKPTLDRTVIDSATPEGKEQTAAFVGKPVLTAKVDAHGRVLEASGGADRLQAELPFRLALPDAAPAVGGTWDRAFAIPLDPPHGTGEKYDAVQTYTLKPAADGVAVVGVTTALKAPPKDPGQLAPLVPLLWEGEVYFHPQTGRYAGAKLTATREVADHQGEGTKFVYVSEYVEAVEK